MMMKKYKAILFDVDGTLLDTSEGIWTSLNFTIREMGLPPVDESEKNRFIGPPIQKSLKERYELDDETTLKAAKIFRDRYSSADLDKARVYDGIFGLFDFLKQNNVKIGVATYKRQDYAQKIMDIFLLSPYCGSIVGADFEGKLTKTDIIALCAENLGCEKNEALMVGDTNGDLIGAKEADIDFLPVSYGFGFTQDDGFETIASSPVDIIEYLKNKV